MGGRSTNYDEEVQRLADEYCSDDDTLNYASRGHAIPSIVGLAKVVGRAKSTLHLWASDENHPFSDTFNEIQEFQELVGLNKSITGEFNAAISKLVLYNHGYSEKSEIEQRSTFAVVSDEVTPEQWENDNKPK